MTSTDVPEKPDPDDDLFEICPVAKAFDILGSKWRLAVLRSIHVYGEQRFSELQRTTTADSSTLSRVLEDLEELDLVTRRLEDKPIATYYDVTDRGASLSIVFDSFEDWALEYTAAEIPEVEVPK